jgi:hypothetical protein
VRKSTLAILLPHELEAHQCPEVHDVIALHSQQQQAKLDEVVLCKDESGNTIAKFGDLSWDWSPLKTLHTGKSISRNSDNIRIS